MVKNGPICWPVFVSCFCLVTPMLLSVSQPCPQLCTFQSKPIHAITSVVSLWFQPSPAPHQHNITEWSAWIGEVAQGGKLPHRQLPSTVGLDVWHSLGDLAGGCSWGAAQSELGLIVLFVFSLHVFLLAPVLKKRQAPWPPIPQSWGPRGGWRLSRGEVVLQHVVASFGARQTVFL